MPNQITITSIFLQAIIYQFLYFVGFYYRIETSKMIPQLFTEDDFVQLYPESPEIATTPTFVVAELLYCNNQIKVKFPSGASHETIQYLMYRQLYLYLLDAHSKNHRINPLLETAKVVGLEYQHHRKCMNPHTKIPKSKQNNKLWYNLWLGMESLQNNCVFQCIIQNKTLDRLLKYEMQGLISVKEHCNQYLMRNQSDGHYYRMKQYNLNNESQLTNLVEFKTSLKEIRHPFIAKLREAHCADDKIYLVFDHTVNSLSNIITHFKNRKISVWTIRSLFIELLYACMYLDLNGILYDEISLSDMDICENGHLVLREEVINFKEASPHFHNVTQRKNKKLESLISIIKQLYSHVEPPTIQSSNLIIQTKKFIHDIETGLMTHETFHKDSSLNQTPHQLPNKKKPSIQMWLEHQWCRELSSQQILGKELQPWPRSKIIPRKLRRQKIFLHFNNLNYLDGFSYEDPRHFKPQLSKIFSIYQHQDTQTNCEHQQTMRTLKIPKIISRNPKASSSKHSQENSLSIIKTTHSSQYIAEQNQNFGHKTSPYQQVIHNTRLSRKRNFLNRPTHQ